MFPRSPIVQELRRATNAVRRAAINATTIRIGLIILQSVGTGTDHTAVYDTLIQIEHRRFGAASDMIAFEFGQSDQLIVVNGSFELIVKLHAIGMRSVDWRSNNDTHRSGRMCNSTINVVRFLLYDDLSSNRIDQRFRQDAFHSVYKFIILLPSSYSSTSL